MWYYSQIALINIERKFNFLSVTFCLIIFLYATVYILFSKVQNIAYKYRMNMCQSQQTNNMEHQKDFRKRVYTMQRLANYAP